MSRGQTFHRYRLVRRIARGGMAEVFLALLRGPSGFEKRVALKKILPVYSGMEEFAVLFRDEARLSAQLEHSSIVQTYEFGSFDGDYFMAMEYVDGPDLEELLDRCRRRGILLPVEVVLHIVHELTRALEYSHNLKSADGTPRAIIHRDVSPPNVLIGVHGEVKLTDFGVAKASDREAETRPGVLRGKYAYMSPEQVRQVDVDHRSDIFSIGIVLYEALTGVNPFEGSTDFQTMEAVEKAEVEPAGFLRPDTPTELDRILLACLEPDPDLRYQSASDLRRDLAEVIRALRTDEGPDQLVLFLRDVFPERTPTGVETPAADLGAPPWELFAHRLAPMAVPMPVAVRRDVARAAGGRLVMGSGAVAGDETAPEIEAASLGINPNAPGPSDITQAGVSTAALGQQDMESDPPTEPTSYDEWVDEDDNPDGVLTQPGVLMRAYGSAEQLGPTYSSLDDLLLPEAHPGGPVRGLDEVPDDVLDDIEERTDAGVPVFNEWDFDGAAENPAHDSSLDLDDHPALASPSGRTPIKQPRQQVTAASSVSPHKAMGVGIANPPPPPQQPRARLRPPGRPRLHPVSRPRVEQLSRPVEPLELGSHPGRQIVTAPDRAHLRVVSDPGPSPAEEAEAAEDHDDTATESQIPAYTAERPLWATVAWLVAAIGVPLASLTVVDWLEEVQREASTPKITSPIRRALGENPAPERRLKALPPSRPGQATPDTEPTEPSPSSPPANSPGDPARD